MKTASIAGECKVVWVIAAAMLARNDVVEMKRPKWRDTLSQSAVFAAISGALLYQSADGTLHQDAVLSLTMALALACRIETRSIAST